jgi:hypothetical protein
MNYNSWFDDISGFPIHDLLQCRLGGAMFVHNKSLQFEVRVTQPDPRFASLMLEQFGGANGELTAALQYFTQGHAHRELLPHVRVRRVHVNRFRSMHPPMGPTV